MQGIDRGSQKYDSIKYRNDRPDARKEIVNFSIFLVDIIFSFF